MTLLIDITNVRSRVAFLTVLRGKRRAIWRSAPTRDAAIRLLAAAKSARLLPARGASCVVVAISAPGAARDASWSAVRAAVATANALAFAWGASSTTVAVTGEESEDDLARLALDMAKRAKKGSRVNAIYSGEPNITQPKSV